MDNSHEPAPVLALHGFTLGGAMFAEVAKMLPSELIAPDLPGHGGRDATRTSWDDAVDEVVDLLRQTRPTTILGYSMGGRLALAAALRRPDLVPRMVLVSTSLGIEKDTERAARRRRDEQDAVTIESIGSAEEFARKFGQAPFLQAPGTAIDLDSLRRANSAEGLVGALRGMGQGSQPYFGENLGRLDMPVVWMAGDRDDKYVAIAKKAAAACRHGTLEIAAAAHNVVAENPAAVVAALVGS